MSITGKRILCKLCFKTIHDNSYETLEGDNKQILEVLLLQVDIESTKQCVICMGCLAMLQKCFEFKSCCLYVEDYISPFIRNSTKIDIGQMLQGKVKMIVDSNIKLCRLCIDIVQDGNCTHLHQNGSQDLVDYIRDCLPELNVNAVYDPLICEKCVSSLREYSSFQKKCRGLNECIKTNRNFKNVIKDDYNSEENVNEIKRNADFDVNTKDEVDHTYNASSTGCIKYEEFDIKDESLQVVGLSSTENGDTLSVTCNETYDNAEENISASLRCSKAPRRRRQTYECNICRHKTLWKDNLRIHMLLHADPSETPVYECNNCTYKARQKSYLKKHMVVHMIPSKTAQYKCNVCPYGTHQKANLKRHKLVHMDQSKTRKYECSTCSYKAQQKSHLKRHMLVHADSSKTAKFVCNTCGFKTLQKDSLKTHMLIHRDCSETAKYECNTCSFKTRGKQKLQYHMLLHTDLSKTPIYECNNCSYKGLNKKCLKKHMFVHTDLSKTEKHECNICPFKTRYKSSLQTHMLVHRDPSYQCSICPHKARRKSHLQLHMSVHKNPNRRQRNSYMKHGRNQICVNNSNNFV